jgi:CTP synthase (UTP-ammonia lyase)
VITPLECSLVGQREAISTVPGSRAAKLYDGRSAVEDFYCNYGVNPAYRNALEAHGLSVSGLGPDGEIRIVELRDHPFFMATLFLPQARSSRAAPHPVLAGYVAAVSSRPH